MAGFIYRDKSTLTILDEPLIMCGLDSVFEIPGMQRTMQGGDPTISRTVTNEYGTITEHLQFQYGIIKCGNSLFTSDEQRLIETWLTSNKYSSVLQVLDEYGYVRFKYYGYFSATTWFPEGDDGFFACTFTFDVNGRYPFEHYEHVYSTNNKSVSGQTIETVINCESDELEEYIYPTVTVKPLDYSNNIAFTLTNLNEEKTMEVNSDTRSSTLRIDCDKCICDWNSDYNNIATFEDLGWEDVGEIYWFRLYPGENPIRFQSSANLELTISYDAPMKKVGGWLI